MNRSLRRLLRVRELVEDLAELDLETKNAWLRGLEAAAETQRSLARQGRADAVEMLLKGSPLQLESLPMQNADIQIAGMKEARLEALAESARVPVEQARDLLLERRRERRQAEILIDAAVSAEEKNRLRRDQNRTDDWFQSRSSPSRTRGQK
ncbi:MAG TPA: hypothetical protein VHE33_06915 [Acidobacteriaceae bacterium]|nr:hypothetical protein [Acidobacteriaceae bacterium]